MFLRAGYAFGRVKRVFQNVRQSVSDMQNSERCINSVLSLEADSTIIEQIQWFNLTLIITLRLDFL